MQAQTQALSSRLRSRNNLILRGSQSTRGKKIRNGSQLDFNQYVKHGKHHSVLSNHGRHSTEYGRNATFSHGKHVSKTPNRFNYTLPSSYLYSEIKPTTPTLKRVSSAQTSPAPVRETCGRSSNLSVNYGKMTPKITPKMAQMSRFRKSSSKSPVQFDDDEDSVIFKNERMNRMEDSSYALESIQLPKKKKSVKQILTQSMNKFHLIFL